MALSQILILLCLAAVMVASLLVARLAQDLQERNMVRLYRLAALDRQRVATRNVIRAVQALDEQPDLMRILYQSLKSDLLRIQQLDPGRVDLDSEIRQAQTGFSTQQEEPRNDKVDKATAELMEQRRQKLELRTRLNSEREVQIARAYIGEAMAIVRRLYHFSHIRADQLESAARYLGTLSVMVAVNSQMNMGEVALAQGDKIKALGCFRRAESLVQRGPLIGRERLDKLAMIEVLQEELLAQSRSEHGLLLLASGD